MPHHDSTPARVAAVALLVDVVCVLAFCTVGRRSHAEGVTLGGVAETAWPFLSGVVVGWLATRSWRQPMALAPQGIGIWLCTVVVGMVLRKATSAGTALSFVIVACLATAVLLLGWRLCARVVVRR